MRKFFHITSIKNKLMLIIMSVSLFGLIVVGSSILIRQVASLNKLQKIDLQILAEIVIDNSSGFLVFDDVSGAQTSLASLKAKKQITRAILFDKEGAYFASHMVGSDSIPPLEDLKLQTIADSSALHELKEIIIDNELMGYLYLESDDSLIREFVFGAIVGLLIILTLTALVAYLLAARLQKIISEPVEHLTETASKITAQQNYDLRAEKESDDEIGVLTDAFNKMLTQLQLTNQEILESQTRFREVIEQSVDPLFIFSDSGSIVDVNNAVCESLGYSRNELLQMGFYDIDQRYKDKLDITSLINQLVAVEHISIETEHKKKTAELIPVEVSFGFLNIKGERLILASARDITERKIAREKLQQANDMLEAKVSERTRTLKAVNEALSEAKERAESANQAKSLFLANMSHEIRTPMNAVIGFTDVLANSGLSEQQLEYVKSIQTGSRNLLSLINDILDLSKIEAGKMKIELGTVYIIQMLQDLKQVYMMSAREKGLDLKLHIDESVPEAILSDELRLRQILFNLVNNAIKFTRQGHIIISAKYSPESANDMFSSLKITVADTGIGIPEEDQQKIFNIFEQQDNQNTREFGGAGLGLSISARLAEKLNAEITVQSKVGQGSCFDFLIKSPEIVTDGKEVADAENIKNVMFKKARVLIVDDIDVNRELISEYLSDQPFEILHASNGEEAINVVKMERPDLVLMDVRMPKLNGIEATRLIREDEAISKTPIIAVTASVVEDKRSDKKRGVFDYILYKPLSREKLNQCLTGFLDIESMTMASEQHYDSIDRLNQELASAPDVFCKQIYDYESLLDQARNSGNFGGMESLLDELCGLATEFELPELKEVVGALRKANQSFDIEQSQKLLTGLVNSIHQLKGRLNDKAV